MVALAYSHLILVLLLGSAEVPLDDEVIVRRVNSMKVAIPVLQDRRTYLADLGVARELDEGQSFLVCLLLVEKRGEIALQLTFVCHLISMICEVLRP